MRYTDKKKKEDNQRKAYDFLISRGIKPHHSAAIVGNLMQESYDRLDSTVENNGAIGIAQWLKSRRTNLENFAKERGTSFKDFDTQLEFLHKELTTTGDSWGRKGMEAFYNTNTAEEAAAAFVNNFERSGENPGDKGYENRINNAKKVFLKFNDPNLYGKDENGNVVSLNPETATPEQLMEAPKIKANFYNQNFGIIEQKFSEPDLGTAPKEQEAKTAVVDVAKEKLEDKNEFITKALGINGSIQDQPIQEEPTTNTLPDPYQMELTPEGNEFFQFFLPEMQIGGEVKSSTKSSGKALEQNKLYSGDLENNNKLPDPSWKTRMTDESIESEKNRVIEYLNSPGYKRILGKTFEDPDNEQQIRVNNVRSTEAEISAKTPVGDYTKQSNIVRINPYSYKDAPAHEFIHAAVKATPEESRLNPVDEYEIDARVKDPYRETYLSNGDTPYIERPEEFQARLNVARMLMKHNNLWDMDKEEFSEKHLNKLKANIKKYPKRWEEIQGFNDTINSTKDEDLIFLLNNVASNNKTTNNNVAKYGGILAPYIK